LKLSVRLKPSEFYFAQFGLVTIIIGLGLAAHLFTILTGHGNLFGFMRLLNVDSEQSIPTYFSLLNLLFASILLFVIYAYEKNEKTKGSRYWLLMSILFLFLSFDESAGVHEKFGNIYIYLREQGTIPPTLNAHEWLPFGVAFVIVVAIVLIPFMRMLNGDTLRNFLIAGGVFVTGAVGIEAIQSAILESAVIDVESSIAYSFGPLFEESFEMYGIAIFNCALYREIVRRNISLSINSR
jgi:hypothetical protein